MLKAKLDSVRKNKKGFSLVELIIVIAIMVALIAVMAPAFVKYVAKARSSALASAAEDYASVCKTIIADPDPTEGIDGLPTSTDKITIEVENQKIKITPSGTWATTLKGKADALSGADTNKTMGATTDKWEITFTVVSNAPVVNLAKASS